MNDKSTKVEGVAIPIQTIPQQKNTRILTPPIRQKQKFEATRTSKTTQKLVVFPEADVDQQQNEQLQQECAFEDLKSIFSEPHLGQQLRRVTAYLTSE